jgi:hypothetical protein
MIASRARLVVSAAVLLAAAACTNFFEIPIETPIQPKLDVSAFQRVLVAGFIAGGSEDIDGNVETVRLLRSQLRSKSQLRVIDADVLPLMEVASENRAPNAAGSNGGPNADAEGGSAQVQEPAAKPQEQTEKPAEKPADPTGAKKIRDEKDLEAYEHLFADVSYWKKVGEEFQNPLIVTGTVMFLPYAKSGFVQQEQEIYDSFGRRIVRPVRTYMERKGFILKPKFIFIDGRDGTTIYSETFREEVLYSQNTSTPALSSYFELMDRLVPSFLSTLSSQKIRGTRVLLK